MIVCRKIFSSSYHLLRAMSFDLHSTPSLLFSALSQSHLLFPAHAQRRFNLKPAPIHAALEVTVSRNPNLAQVLSPTRLSTTRTSLNRRVLSLLKRVRFQKLGDKFSLPYNQSLRSSTQYSVESLATPQEADLDDEQIRALLASPRYLPEGEASAERSQIYHSEREGLEDFS